jgi:hypothetical protein
MNSDSSPKSACLSCWRTWLNARPRAELGYCWHGKVAWRVKAGDELAIAEGVTREEHLAMLEYLNEIELLVQTQPGVQNLQLRPRA